MKILLFLLLPILGFSQTAFRSPSGLTIVAPAPKLGVTTIYDYTITDGKSTWGMNSYNWRVSIPVGPNKCKIYLLIKEYRDMVLVNRKMLIFYETI